MKGSGRRSAADEQAARLVVALEPTRKLTAAERKTWNKVVSSVSADHFSASDAILLEQYCATVEAFEAARKAKDTKTMEAMGRLSFSCATRLRVTPQSRYDARAAARSIERGRARAIEDPLIGGRWN